MCVIMYIMKRSAFIPLKRSLFVILCLLLCLSCKGTQTADDPVPSAGQATETVPAPTETIGKVVPETNSEAPKTALPEPETSEPNGTPTEIPTPEPTPTVPPVSDEQLDEGYLDAWFDDSVLIGDSLVAGLDMYVTKERSSGSPCLGNMNIFGVSALTLKRTLAGERKETAGQVMFYSRYTTVSDVVEQTHAKRLFLQLGVNDLKWYSAEELIDVYDEIISIVKADHPDLRIYVHSLMPMFKDYAVSVLPDYETHKTASKKLRALCEQKGYTYLELADLICDEDGYLKYEYSASDCTVHLNSRGKVIWVRLLRSCARDEYYAGIWSPEEAANNG